MEKKLARKWIFLKFITCGSMFSNLRLKLFWYLVNSPKTNFITIIVIFFTRKFLITKSCKNSLERLVELLLIY